jgi:hypothetical protein
LRVAGKLVLSSVRKLAKIIGENVNQGHRSKN